MPPFLFSEDTTFETKEWATSTIDNLFSNNNPVSFEPSRPYVQEHKSEPIIPTIQHVKANSKNLTRRSVSVLESNLFDRHQNDVKVRSRATSSMETDSTSSPPLGYSDSAPSLLITHQATSPISLSARIKRTWTPEKSHMSKKSLSSKEREGIHIWKSTLQKYLAESKMLPRGQSPHLLRFILNELLSTEITYLNHLLIVKQMFMDPLAEAATTYPRPLVNIKDIQTIFAFIPELISLSSTLIHRLKDAICTTENEETQGSIIGRVFCELEDEFDIYISYAANFSKQQRCIERADRSIVYRQLVQESLRKKETNRMGLSDYMIAPIQRITRYGLLLKDLAKHLNPESADFMYMQRSLKCHLALAHAMNEVQ